MRNNGPRRFGGIVGGSVELVPELQLVMSRDDDRFAPPEKVRTTTSTLRSSQRRLARWVRVTDATALVVAIAGAHMLRYVVLPMPSKLGPGHPYLISVSIGLFIGWMAALSLLRTRDAKVLDAGSTQYQLVARASFLVFGWLAIMTLVLRLAMSRGFLLIAGITGILLLFGSRRAWRTWVMHRRAHGSLMSQALIIGGVRSAEMMAERFAADAGYGLRVVGVWVPDRVVSRGERFRYGDIDVPVLGLETHLAEAIMVNGEQVDTVVVTDTEHLGHDGMRELAWALEGRDVDLLVAPNVIDVAGPRVHLEAHGNMPLIYLSGPRYSRARSMTRAIFDRGFATLVLLGSAPILLMAMLAVRLTSRGPVFYRSERIGAHGVPFQMYKLRTMVRDADQVREELVKHNMSSGPLFKMQNDPRVTTVGRFLRRYSIDELPQFLNVLKGDMSVVGPRPPLRAEVETYSDTIRRRLLIKQGVTGLWQVSGRSDLSWEDSIRLDLDYVENWSMLRDLQIIFRTLRAVIASHGAY
jgi:exopolysaccharide biosynthesis polyprenyl glycosylphosphotransferase